jgi:hypothetical protein
VSRRFPGGPVLFLAVAIVVLVVLIAILRLAAEAFAEPALSEGGRNESDAALASERESPPSENADPREPAVEADEAA